VKTPFPEYLRPCGWNALLPSQPVRLGHSGHRRCDVIVVGGGYTGLAAARRWHELAAHHEIVVLEASRIGEGSPGRNSGFLLEVSLANDASAAEIDRMQKCNDLISGKMQDLAALVQQHQIDCDLRRTGTYRAAAGEAGLRAIRAYANFLQAANLSHEILPKDVLHARIGSDFYAEGLYSPDCYLVQPAALIRGLANALPPPVLLYEETPALKISRCGSGWEVTTPKGTVVAQNVVVANNAFAKSLGFGRSRVTTIYTYAGLTHQIPTDVLNDMGSDASWGLLPAHRLGSTLRRTVDNRILIRSCYDYERESDNRAMGTVLLDALQRRFPHLSNLSFEYIWSGATGLTLNGSPNWGKISNGLYLSAGCNGGGVVKGTLFGSALADLALDRQIVDITRLFGSANWMPPDPFRKLGFSMVSALERRRGLAEI